MQYLHRQSRRRSPPLSPRVRGYVAAPAADMVAHTVTPARALDGAFGQAQEKPRPQLGSAHHGKYGVSLSSPPSRRGMGASSTLRARHVRVSRGDDRVFLPRPDHRHLCTLYGSRAIEPHRGHSMWIEQSKGGLDGGSVGPSPSPPSPPTRLLPRWPGPAQAERSMGARGACLEFPLRTALSLDNAHSKPLFSACPGTPWTSAWTACP